MRPPGWNKWLKGQSPPHSGFKVCAATTGARGVRGAASPPPPMLGNEPRFPIPGRRQQGLRDAEVNCSLTCVTESRPSALQPQLPFPPLTATRLGSLYPLCRVSRALEEEKKKKKDSCVIFLWNIYCGGSKQHFQIIGWGTYLFIVLLG